MQVMRDLKFTAGALRAPRPSRLIVVAERRMTPVANIGEVTGVILPIAVENHPPP